METHIKLLFKYVAAFVIYLPPFKQVIIFYYICLFHDKVIIGKQFV